LRRLFWLSEIVDLTDEDAINAWAFFRFDGVIQPEKRIPNMTVVKKATRLTNRGWACVAIRDARHFGRRGSV
jgi:hypothetical protein